MRRGLSVVLSMAVLVLVLILAWTLAMSAQPTVAYERLVRRMTPVTHWSATHAPAVATKATTTQAALAGAVHVADCVMASLIVADTAAGAVTTVVLSLRDGATGAGTVLGSWDFTVPVTANTNAPRMGTCGLHIAGTQGVAMTLEFSAAGSTNTFEKVVLTGYDR